MTLWLYLVASIALGVVIAMQPLMNAVLARAIGSPYGAAGISIAVALVGAIAIMAVAGRGDMSRANLVAVPWWIYLAGFAGTAFVAGGVVIAPVTGALLFFLCVIAGQLRGGSVDLNRFRAFSKWFSASVMPLPPRALAG